MKSGTISIALQRGNAALLIDRDTELPDIGVKKCSFLKYQMDSPFIIKLCFLQILYLFIQILLPTYINRASERQRCPSHGSWYRITEHWRLKMFFPKIPNGFSVLYQAVFLTNIIFIHCTTSLKFTFYLLLSFRAFSLFTEKIKEHWKHYYWAWCRTAKQTFKRGFPKARLSCHVTLQIYLPPWK